MKSIRYIEKLNKIKVGDEYKEIKSKDFIKIVSSKNELNWYLEASLGFQSAFENLMNNLNIPDELKKAHSMTFTNVEDNLYEHFLDTINKGDDSVRGFISALKGKYFELKLNDHLNETFEGYRFEISSNPINPIWDIKGIDENGEEILIQAKMWNDGNLSELAEIMKENPDVLYGVNNEIKEKIIERAPELTDQFIADTDYSNIEFSDEINEDLETLVQNRGIDISDSLTNIIPHIREILLGIALTSELAKIAKHYKRVDMLNKSKIGSVRVMLIFTRYGVSVSLCSVGASLGVLLGPFTSISGGLAGAIISSKINKKILPRLNTLFAELVKIDVEDMFYYNNKKMIDYLAIEYKNKKTL